MSIICYLISLWLCRNINRKGESINIALKVLGVILFLYTFIGPAIAAKIILDIYGYGEGSTAAYIMLIVSIIAILVSVNFTSNKK